MRRTLLALVLAAVTVLGFATFTVGNAGAWKCDKHPEKAPNCTTTTGPPVSVSQPDPSTSVPTTVPVTTTSTTSTLTTVPHTAPPTAPPPEVTPDPPTIIRLAG